MVRIPPASAADGPLAVVNSGTGCWASACDAMNRVYGRPNLRRKATVRLSRPRRFQPNLEADEIAQSDTVGSLAVDPLRQLLVAGEVLEARHCGLELQLH